MSIDIKAKTVLHLPLTDGGLTSTVRAKSGADGVFWKSGYPQGTWYPHLASPNPPYLGGAFNFNSNYQMHICLGAPLVLTGAWSASFWVNVSNYSGDFPIAARVTGNGAVSVDYGSGSILFRDSAGNIKAWSSAVGSYYNVWRHVVINASGAAMRVWTNGVESAGGSQSPGAGTNLTIDAVGRRGAVYLWGKLADLRLFTGQLSAEEIAFLYNSGAGRQVGRDTYDVVYGGEDGDIDYQTPLGYMDTDDDYVTVPAMAMGIGEVWHFVRRTRRPCGLESADSPVCIVRMDGQGELVAAAPNEPWDISAEPSAGGKAAVRWRYDAEDQQVAPTGFRIYIDSGSGFDFQTPDATVAYSQWQDSYTWTSDALTNGVTYRFCVRSYVTGGGESANTDSAEATADSVGPAAATGLSISVEDAD